MEQADAERVAEDPVLRHLDVVGDGDLEADHAVVEHVVHDAHVLGGRHPHRGVERSVGDVVPDQTVRRDGRVDAVVEVAHGLVGDELEAVHPARLDAVAREVLDREAAQVEAAEHRRAGTRVRVVLAACGRRVDAGLLGLVAHETHLAGLAAALDHLADQAQVRGADAQPVAAVRPLAVHTRFDEDGVARRRAVDRGLDRLPREHAVHRGIGGRRNRECRDSRRNARVRNLVLFIMPGNSPGRSGGRAARARDIGWFDRHRWFEMILDLMSGPANFARLW